MDSCLPVSKLWYEAIHLIVFGCSSLCCSITGLNGVIVEILWWDTFVVSVEWILPNFMFVDCLGWMNWAHTTWGSKLFFMSNQAVLTNKNSLYSVLCFCVVQSHNAWPFPYRLLGSWHEITTHDCTVSLLYK